MRHSTRKFALIAAILVGGIGAPRAPGAADPVAYTMQIAPSGNAMLDQALTDASTLLSLHDSGPVGAFALIARAHTDAARFTAALHSFGFYKGTVRLVIDGRPLDEPGLTDALDQAPAEPPAEISASVDPGPLFHLRRVEITGEGAAGLKTPERMPGAPAVAAVVLAERARLLAELRGKGFALASVGEPVAYLRTDENALDVDFPVITGPHVDLGKIGVTGLDRVNESFVRNRLLLRPGEPFDPVAIEAARQDLAQLGLFSTVRVQLGTTLDAQGRLPLEIDLTERPPHSFRASAGYSTDLGAELAGSWQNRNLFGDGENLLLSAAVNEGGTAQRNPGYSLGGLFTLPDFGHRDQTLSFGLTAAKQDFLAYQRSGILATTRLERRFLEHWRASIGISAEQEHIIQEAVARDYTLVGLPIEARYDSSDNVLDPTGGIRAVARVTPTQSLSRPSATFTLMELSGATYFDAGTMWGAPGRSVVALRGLVGESVGASQFQLPPNQRFYAGGGQSVRGYRYQSVGPHFADNKPQGGTAVVAGSVELRQRILESYGVVAFVDAGRVNAPGSPGSGILRVGTGLGVRYYTAIGPIRLDFAVPLNRQPGGDSFEVYFGIGQAF